ncbi:uncharacterized protein LOC113303332 [Papaver somniferum]|uniref:uncharacterized protein LOC113303332 n=1 Tax=Papaver somniferum TaxID=3469 RepID=UPI000E702DB6|nr:uncharacterized protein LOC113303332 [Papaver somniferum]
MNLDGLLHTMVSFLLKLLIGQSLIEYLVQFRIPLIFWKLNLPPKIKHFLCKCINDCLAVNGNIGRYVQHVDKKCPLCNTHIETVDHLLLDCHVIKDMYTGVNSVFTGMYNGNNLKNWVATWYANVTTTRQTNHDFIISAGFMLWHSWKSRCAKVFDHAWKSRCAKVFDNVQVQVNLYKRRVQGDITNWNNAHRQQNNTSSGTCI